jgi:hypothetical protein
MDVDRFTGFFVNEADFRQTPSTAVPSMNRALW